MLTRNMLNHPGASFFRAVAAETSPWTPKSARRQNRENGHTHRHAGQLL